MSLKLKEFEVRHVYEETNMLADIIASTHPARIFHELHLDNFAPLMKLIVTEDATGKIS